MISKKTHLIFLSFVLLLCYAYPQKQITPAQPTQNNNDIVQTLYQAAQEGDNQFFFSSIITAMKKKVTINYQKLLHNAIKSGNTTIIEALLTILKINVNIQDKHGNTPLILAAKKGNINVCIQLITHEASITLGNKNKYTPLHAAVEAQCQPIINMLLNMDKTLIHAQTIYGNTPLHFAAKNGYAEIYLLLEAEGANVTMKNNDEKTAMQLAIEHGHYAVYNAIVEKYATPGTAHAYKKEITYNHEIKIPQSPTPLLPSQPYDFAPPSEECISDYSYFNTFPSDITTSLLANDDDFNF